MDEAMEQSYLSSSMEPFRSTIKVFDEEYPLRFFDELERDPSGAEITNSIMENTHKMTFNYWNADLDQISFVVYLSTTMKKESAAHKCLHSLLKKTAERFGVNWAGKPICNFMLSVGTSDVHVSILFRSTWPSPTTPMPPGCNAPKSNRRQCPRCKFWNPTDDMSLFCVTCQLIMESSDNITSPLVDQLCEETCWRQVGKDIIFKMLAKPSFLQDRLARCDRISPEIESDQLKSYIKLHIGSHPTMSVLLRVLNRGVDRTHEVVFVKDGECSPDPYRIKELLEAARRLHSKTSPLQVVCTITHNEEEGLNSHLSEHSSSLSPSLCTRSSRSYRKRKLEVVQSESGQFTVTLRLYVVPSYKDTMGAANTRHNKSSVQKSALMGIIRGEEKQDEGPGDINISDDVQQVETESNDDVFMPVSGASRGIWSNDCHVLCAFLSGWSMVSTGEQLGESPVKARCPETSLLRASSNNTESGGYSGLDTSLESILEAVCREALRIGKVPPGFGLQEHVPRRHLSSTFNRGCYPWHKNYTQSMSMRDHSFFFREDEMSEYLFDMDEYDTSDAESDDDGIDVPLAYLLHNRDRERDRERYRDGPPIGQLSIKRHFDLIQCNSLSAVMCDLENLGHPLYSLYDSTPIASELGSTGIKVETMSTLELSSKAVSSASVPSTGRDILSNSSYTIPGLRVVLRHYQRQTLSWALEQEHLEGGIIRLITAPIIGTDGSPTGMWYTPVTGEFTNCAPPDIRGGFICDEMGMGKTIIILSLILCHRAPPVDSELADVHWGGAANRKVSAFTQRHDAEDVSANSIGKSVVPMKSVSSAVMSSLVEESSEMKENINNTLGLTLDASLNRNSSSILHSNVTDSQDSIKPPHVSHLKAGLPPSELIRSRATLVVCPVSLVGQWCSEVRDKLGLENCKVVGYHGQNRERDLNVLSTCDVVITTYETLGADLRMTSGSKKSKPGAKGKTKKLSGKSSQGYKVGNLFGINWHRIVLDESHRIRGKSSMSDAVGQLISKRRWCVTGTPVNTKMSDFAGQFRFIGVPTVDNPKYWTDIICRPNARAYRDLQMNNVDPSLGFASLMTLLRRVVMRHSKSMHYVSTNEPLLLLPAKHESICMITLSPDEKEKYVRLETILAKRYKHIIRQGSYTFQRSTIQLLMMIKDLQMVCSGGLLPGQLSELLITDINDSTCMTQFGECCICLDLMDDPMVTACGHIFCADCIYGTLGHTLDGKASCPLCRSPVNGASLKPASAADIRQNIDAMAKNGKMSAKDGDENDHESEMCGECPLAEDSDEEIEDEQTDTTVNPAHVSSTVMVSKLEWLVHKLQAIHTRDKTAKVLVFSQFNQTIQWLQATLPSRGFKFRCLCGNMSMQQRRKALDDFQTDRSATIFLLSMRAGAVGVNLTQANHVVVMEPCLNTALEEQAIGRVHRIGQTREVHIYRLACRDSIEERILWSQQINRGARSQNNSGHTPTHSTASTPLSVPNRRLSDNEYSPISTEDDRQETTNDMLLHLRMSGRSSPSISYTPVGALSHDRVTMGKKQYDLLFGLSLPSPEVLARIGQELHPQGGEEDNQPLTDMTVDIKIEAIDDMNSTVEMISAQDLTDVDQVGRSESISGCTRAVFSDPVVEGHVHSVHGGEYEATISESNTVVGAKRKRRNNIIPTAMTMTTSTDTRTFSSTETEVYDMSASRSSQNDLSL